MAVTPLPQGTIVQVRIVQSLYGQRVLNVLHYRADGNPGTTVNYVTWMNQLSGSLTADDRLVDRMRQCQSNDVLIERIVCQPVYSLRLAGASNGINMTGAYQAAARTPNVAASISKETVFASRKGIGRVQLAGIPSAVYAEGYITDASYKNLLGDFAAELLYSHIVVNGANEVIFTPCLWSPKTAQTSYDVVGATVRTTVRTMRRRTVGVGE